VIVELGAFALILALVLSVLQTGMAAAGRLRRSPVLAGAAEGAALACAGVVALAFAALILAFAVSDFSVANVAANSHTDKPMLYKISAAWGSHESSLVLWCLVLTGFGAVLARARGLPFGLKASAVATQGLLGVLFLAFAVFTSNPFERLDPAPFQGGSLNPLLQDPALAFHPPFLYAGYVGFSVCFSLAVAALIEGRANSSFWPAWGRWVRPWALASWAFLTVGITLGAFWAYYELGWGGWWFWDPVENASFLPWLPGAAACPACATPPPLACTASPARRRLARRRRPGPRASLLVGQQLEWLEWPLRARCRWRTWLLNWPLVAGEALTDMFTSAPTSAC
jgi:cytochrome c-type biogenesis protein CcmF